MAVAFAAPVTVIDTPAPAPLTVPESAWATGFAVATNVAAVEAAPLMVTAVLAGANV